jgi:hypothetical protein
LGNPANGRVSCFRHRLKDLLHPTGTLVNAADARAISRGFR